MSLLHITDVHAQLKPLYFREPRINLGVGEAFGRPPHLAGYRYKLLPVFVDLLEPDAAMVNLIEQVQAPYRKMLDEPHAITESLLYRRGNFTGTFDQIILDALLAVTSAEHAEKNLAKSIRATT